MERITIFLIDIGILSITSLIVMIILLLIQLISYKMLNFNIYKTILKKFDI